MSHLPRLRLACAFCALTAAAFAAPAAAPSARAVAGLRTWLATPVATRPDIALAPFAAVALTRADAETAANALWEDRLATLRRDRAAEVKAKVIRMDGLEMKFDTVSFGASTRPKGGRSLFISMHGGGGAPAEVNDSQWRNQIALAANYKPKEGIYLAPRAPSNDWDLWHKPHIDAFCTRLIEDFVAVEGVNPDKVYLLGYSAGGDGAYRLATRMADRWAAASMMAGHPGDVSAENLRNLPFSVQVGELDGAYRRNAICTEWGVKLGALRKADPKGYEHFVELHKGRPHWMGGDDRKAIPWMEKFTRNPLPERIVRVANTVAHDDCYWIGVQPGTSAPGSTLTASRAGNKITVSTQNTGDVFVRLHDTMTDLDAPVTLTRDTAAPLTLTPTRTIATLARTLAARGDRRLMFPVEIPLPAPAAE